MGLLTLRELEARLRKAGFRRQTTKGSHRKWIHPAGRFVVISGNEGDDAKQVRGAEREGVSLNQWIVSKLAG
jgi:predicted RNA binding protein YcfA (HicA-like mRNA interferase family)